MTTSKWFLGEVSVGYKRTDESIFKDTLSKKMMRNSDNVVDFFRAIFPKEMMEHHEEMWVGYLNQNNRPIGFMQLAKGTTNGTLVNTKELLQGALMCNASKVIIMHNHPSGNTTPSDADIQITQKVKQGLTLFDMVLIDHIILTLDSYTSMADDGLL
jgi:DNA repair protein RadC